MVVSGTRINDGSTCEVYEIKSDKWEDLPNMKNGRYYHSSCSFNGEKVFVFCGLCSKTKKYLDSIEFLDFGA